MRSARLSYALHAEAARSGEPPGELRERLAARRSAAGATRRELILGAGSLAAAAALARTPAAGAFAPGRAHAGAPRIAIVGAGLAGLRCAHRLWTESPAGPVAASVYEANPERSGGRCWTLRDFFAGGLSTEHGGSFLNSDQTAVRGLAARLGLAEEIVNGGDLLSGEEVYLIGGARYSYGEANADWEAFGYEAFRRAAKELHGEAGEAGLDSMSVPEWLESSGIGASSRFGRLMMANTVTENGGDPAEQSALDLIELLTHNPRVSLSPLPGDDEKYHVVGGNDQLVSGMIAELPGETVNHDHVLQGLRTNSDRSITLSFAVAGASREVTADFVVLALPFSTLRAADLSRSGLSAEKRRVIETLGMGTNAKIHLELTHKTWPALGLSGASYGEFQRLACAWDDCVQLGPSAEPALYVGFPGGTRGLSGISGAAHGSAPPADAAWALGELEPIIPGTTAAFTGRAYEDHWALDPWVQGAYSYYRVGQASSYGVIAGRTEGRILFAGEHTSIVNIGFLDGAVETGERAASRLLARLA
jgi:monoamine oxidase